jgi:hypothetical protein
MSHNLSSHKDQEPVIKIGIEDGPLRELDHEVSDALTSMVVRSSVPYETVIATAVINQNQVEEFVGRGAQLLIKNGRKIRFLDYS